MESLIGLPGALPLLLSGKLLPTLQKSAATSPIREDSLQQCRQNSGLLCVWPTHTPLDSHPDLIGPHITLTRSLKQPPPPWPGQCLWPESPWPEKTMVTVSGLASQAPLQRPLHPPFLLAAVDLMLSRTSFYLFPNFSVPVIFATELLQLN